MSVRAPATLLHLLTLLYSMNRLQNVVVQQQAVCGMHIPVVQYILIELSEPFKPFRKHFIPVNSVIHVVLLCSLLRKLLIVQFYVLKF